MRLVVLVDPEDRARDEVAPGEGIELLAQVGDALAVGLGGVRREGADEAVLGDDQRLLRIGLLDEVQPGLDLFGGAAPAAEVGVGHEEVGLVQRGVVAPGRDAHVGVREGEEACGVEPADRRLHAPHVVQAAGQACVALVADAPREDAGVVAVRGDHLAQHPLGQGLHARVLQLGLAELPHRNLRHQQDAVAIGVVEHRGRLRIVHRPRQRRVQRAQVVPVMQDAAAGLGQAFPGRVLVARQAGQPHRAIVDPELAVAQLDAAQAQRVGARVQHLALLVLQLGDHAVELAVADVPQPRPRDGQAQVRAALSSGRQLQRLACGGRGRAVRREGGGDHLQAARAGARVLQFDAGIDLGGCLADGAAGQGAAQRGAQCLTAHQRAITDAQPHVAHQAAEMPPVVPDAAAARQAHRVAGNAARGRPVVHGDHQQIRLAAPQQPGDVEGMGRVAAFVLTDLHAVEPDAAAIERGAEVQLDMRIRRERQRQIEPAEVPAGALEVDVRLGVRVPGVRHGHAARVGRHGAGPAGGHALVLRIGAELPAVVDVDARGGFGQRRQHGQRQREARQHSQRGEPGQAGRTDQADQADQADRLDRHRAKEREELHDGLSGGAAARRSPAPRARA